MIFRPIYGFVPICFFLIEKNKSKSFLTRVLLSLLFILNHFRTHKTGSPEDKKAAAELKARIDNRKTEFRELEDTLPHENG